MGNRVRCVTPPSDDPDVCDPSRPVYHYSSWSGSSECVLIHRCHRLGANFKTKADCRQTCLHKKHPTSVKFDYTNNKNCVVANFPYKGEVCILWVPKAYVSSVPQECIDQYEDICDAEVPAYEEGLCDDALGG
ncbi:uncharacterized protein [Dermacentor albipictus]|uniref:uncharacterized protein isoform X2 n=1 Tax=Dermacentor albipictus TaxID=60249 RepID=UPI0038FD0852